MSEGWLEKLGRVATKAAESFGKFMVAHEILTAENPLRELLKRQRKLPATDLDELMATLKDMSSVHSEDGNLARQLLRRHRVSKDRSDEILELLTDAPSIARREIVNHSRSLSSNDYDDLVMILDFKARMHRSDAIAELAEYAEEVGARNRR